MQDYTMKAWLNSSYLFGANQNWIEELYEDFLTDPNSVELHWRSIFQQLSDAKIRTDQFHSKIRDYFRLLAKKNLEYYSDIFNLNSDVKQLRVLQLINAYRFYGYRNAKLDPLNLWRQDLVSDLDPAYYGLTEISLQETFNVDSFAVGKHTMKLKDLIHSLKKIYCDSIGIEYMHIPSKEERYWIQKNIESTINRILFSANEKKRFLSELTFAEGFERYLGAKFPGVNRFSLEGGDALIPMLKELIRHARKKGTYEIVLGMTHRGRLNVLVNVLGKKPQDLFDEFLEKNKNQFGTGDVKYHMGFSSDIKTESGLVHLILAFNPSHLEIINPVVIGSARAHLDRLNEPNSNKVLAVAIHGDAALMGQGVVQETLNMSRTCGYKVGGTIHIVINNQIGFTTSSALNIRSIPYCTDISKIVQAPIFHVNGDDLEATILVVRLALDYRNTFKRDVFIDLVCYRRHGHNETDEPSVTQPLMYRKIKKHPTSRKIYADKLALEKVITLEDAIKMIKLYRKTLDSGECVIKELDSINMSSFCWSYYLNYKWDMIRPNKIKMNRLQQLAKYISVIPNGIKMQSRVAKIYANRQSMAVGDKPFDWGSAEMLAYATLLDEGISVRLSGEDVSRGTFFHRHAIVHNQINGTTYIPLQHIHEKQGKFKIWDSVLSEEAVLAFEYGYSISEPNTLTIWEAQFGDFANGAQVVIDQFISSGEQKWGRMCNLVMFLPHGYEGQGPEHSSARLERYLQLCAEQNIQICIPSTPAQIYHMLRRQVLCSVRRPLVVMSPKSLLRHPLAVSNFNELANSTFLLVIGEIDELDPRSVKRVVLCSGKVYYDLLEQRRKNRKNNVAIIRIEQLYPFPYQAVQNVLKLYIHVHDFVWCQEEPLNQGAWCCSQHRFRKVIPHGSTLNYISRPASASSAVGYMSVHQRQQQDLINNALNIE